ncbi:MAG: SCO family protein [Ignavibacteriaceae bacterium]
MKKFYLFFCSVLLFTSFNKAPAADINDKVGVVKKLNATIPLDLTFYDSDGKKVLLRDLVNKPTIIDFAYYKCTGICTPLMTEIADVVGKVDLVPGKDYNLLTVSINPAETSFDAANKKVEMMDLITKKIPSSSWRFLTGDSLSIKTLADAAGFNFERQGDTFLHTGVLIFVSPDGKICRYLEPGYDAQGNFRILPLDFKMAVIDASKGLAVPVVDEIERFCFSFQPKNKSYVIDIFKISGTGILLLVGIFVVFVLLKPKKKKVEPQSKKN